MELVAGAGLNITNASPVCAHRKELGVRPCRYKADGAAGVVNKRDLGVQFQPVGHPPTTRDCGGGDVFLEASGNNVSKCDAGNGLKTVDPKTGFRPIVV